MCHETTFTKTFLERTYHYAWARLKRGWTLPGLISLALLSSALALFFSILASLPVAFGSNSSSTWRPTITAAVRDLPHGDLRTAEQSQNVQYRYCINTCKANIVMIRTLASFPGSTHTQEFGNETIWALAPFPGSANTQEPRNGARWALVRTWRVWHNWDIIPLHANIKAEIRNPARKSSLRLYIISKIRYQQQNDQKSQLEVKISYVSEFCVKPLS